MLFSSWQRRRNKPRAFVIAVTGAAGFVGVNLLHEFARRGEQVIGFDLASPRAEARTSLAALPTPPHFETLDVCDAAAVENAFTLHRPDIVVHAAAITASERRERNQGTQVVAVNVAGTQSILDACARTPVRRIVYVSSGAVYGHATFGTTALDEAATLEPSSLYGITKRAGEQLARRHHELHGTEIVIARLSALFGMWEQPTSARDFMSPFRQAAMAASRGEPIRYLPDEPRNWISAADAALALVELATRERLAHDCFNVCPTERFGLDRCIEVIRRRRASADAAVVDDPDQATLIYDADPRQPRANVLADRLINVLGDHWWTPPDISIDAYLSWLDQMPEWN
jgi:nucleoside-diphosphate-sugar epimerase